MENVNSFNYKILPELKLIIENWSGELSLKEIFEYKNGEVLDPNWKSYYYVLADDRAIQIKTDFIDENMNDYLPLSQNFNKDRKTAILTQSPSQVAANILLNMQKSSKALVEMKIFSTLKAALIWLGIDLKESEKINNILEELKIRSTIADS